ncbi:MAG: thioredoxin family protein [Saprospiraceae bacterium]
MKKIVTGITPELLSKAQKYKEYRVMLDELMTEKKTTGNNHSEAMLHYAEMNIRRMKRWDKRTKILPEVQEMIENIDKKVILLTITEGWCGDAAQIVPVIEHLSNLNTNIEQRLILRDENLEIMDEFLTNGGRSIPMTIFLDADSLDVLGHWGPKPKEMQDKLIAEKAAGNFDYPKFSQELHKWYAKDKAVNVQLEFSAALKEALKTEVLAD